jgi:membrane-associated phospholipid phosphatase
MMTLHTFYALPVWPLVTRLGEAEILLPAALLTALDLFFRAGQRRLASSWMALLLLAVACTTASKLAFIGWGLGVAAINFTGVSGHTMFAAAIYPMLVVSLVGAPAASGSSESSESSEFHKARYLAALLLGCLLALVVGLSRIAVGAHSWSEMLAGLLLGGAVTAAVLMRPASVPRLITPGVLVLALVCISASPGGMPASQTHSLVTRLALHLSNHAVPYTRSDLLGRNR